MRCVLPIVLVLAAPAAAFAEPVCHTIRRGESAAQVARRLTGDSWNAYRPWFEIRNTSSKFIPKSQYNRIRPGWHACVTRALPGTSAKTLPVVALAPPVAIDAAIEAPVAIESAAAVEAVEPFVDSGAATATEDIALPSPAPPATRSIVRLDFTMVWIGASMVVPWFGWRILDRHLVRRRTATIVMQHYARRFIDEFERPLVRYDAADRPVRSRLRYRAGRRRLDILLAPGDGRSYPNLSDHKQNLEYDVSRIMQILGDDSFVSGSVYTQEGWVVVPFRFKAGPKPPGVTCISSL